MNNKLSFGLLVLLVFLFGFALTMASAATASVVYFILAFFALFGRMHAVSALVMMWFFVMVNPGIVGEIAIASVGRYFVILSASISVFVRSGFLFRCVNVKKITALSFMLGVVIVVHSIFVSPFVDVSVLKATLWTLTTCTLIAAWAGMTQSQSQYMIKGIFNFLLFILIVSVPFLFLPAGYLKNGTGFQGVLNHPQAFGPAMAILGAWYASKMFSEKKPGWFAIVVAGLSVVMVFLSEARTAGLALVLGILISIFVAPILARRPLKLILPGLYSPRFYFIIACLLFLSVLNAQKITDVMLGYISKSGRAESSSVLEAYEGSRGSLIDKMWLNIESNPFFGIGFGVSSDPMTMEVQRDSVLGLPTSVPIEKGVFILAALEELGALVFLLVVFWIFMLLNCGARSGVAPVTIGLTILFLNMGEATLFSPGGFGMLPLVFLTWVIASNSAEKNLEC